MRGSTPCAAAHRCVTAYESQTQTLTREKERERARERERRCLRRGSTPHAVLADA
jgi:hypothetical protein